MKKQTKKSFLIFSAIASSAFLFATSFAAKQSFLFPFANGNEYVQSGNHYARVAPTETESGVKEYYVSCDDHQHYVLEDGKMYFRGVHYSDANNIQIIIANYTSSFNKGSNFLAKDDDGYFDINQTDSTVTQAGWFSQAFVEGKYRLITACFPNAAQDGQIWVIKADSLLTDDDGVKYHVDKDYRFTFSSSRGSWKMETPSMIPDGNWSYDTSLTAPRVDMEDDRYISASIPTFDISSTSVGYNASGVIQVNCDLNLGEGIYTDGGSFDISEVRVYKNDELTPIHGIQYYHTESGTSLLSMSLGSAAADAAGDVLRFVAGSVFKITINDVTYSRKLAKDTYYSFDGSHWACTFASNLPILPVSDNVQWNMIFIRCGNIFHVAGDTAASFNGTMKLNGETVNGTVTATSSGFYISGIGTLNGTSFTFSMSKYSTITSNSITALMLSDYNVSFNGTSFSWN